mmetsp:Transcript_28162/g.43388  ORF Transcript_28162/g.43388 Transcript_28162/m.43388 type:complete len:289 (+) Transcript_28162:83-949(+)
MGALSVLFGALRCWGIGLFIFVRGFVRLLVVLSLVGGFDILGHFGLFDVVRLGGLGCAPLQVVVSKTKRKEHPESAHLKHCSTGGVSEWLEDDHRELTVVPEVARDRPDFRGLAVDLLELVKATSEKSNGKHQCKTGHEEGQPELVLHLVVSNVDAGAKDSRNGNTDKSRDGDGFGTSSQEEGNQENSAFRDFTPDIPGNIEANLVVGDHIVIFLGNLFLPREGRYLPVETKPHGNLYRELQNANGCNNLGYTLDNLNSGLVEVLGKDGKRNSKGEHYKDSDNGGEGC